MPEFYMFTLRMEMDTKVFFRNVYHTFLNIHMSSAYQYDQHTNTDLLTISASQHTTICPKGRASGNIIQHASRARGITCMCRHFLIVSDKSSAPTHCGRTICPSQSVSVSGRLFVFRKRTVTAEHKPPPENTARITMPQSRPVQEARPIRQLYTGRAASLRAH